MMQTRRSIHIITISCILMVALFQISAGQHPEHKANLTVAQPIRKARENFWTFSSATRSQMRVGTSGLQLARDEFNATENLFKQQYTGKNTGASPLMSLVKRLLLSYQLDECCPSWTNLTQHPDIVGEQKRVFGKNSPKARLEPGDLLAELKRVYLNISYLSIDGQEGSSVPEKYYRFCDDVHYYLRLMTVAEIHLAELEQRISSSAATPTSSDPESATSLAQSSDTSSRPRAGKLQLEDIEFKRQLQRQTSAIAFRVAQDPTLASFLGEMLPQTEQSDARKNARPKLNENFELYETFIRYTTFGQYYASNISMVRESCQVFDLICAHLNQINFPSNLTRPSKQYAIIRRLSRELFKIRHDLLERVNLRVLSQNQEVRRMFDRLNDLIAAQPHIRMLGDEFGTDEEPGDELFGFSANVRQVTHLLDLYTTNNMTQLTFYDQLSELPEEFVLLALAIAREYESKELPNVNRFDFNHYNWEYSSQGQDGGDQRPQLPLKQHNDSQEADSPRHSNRPFLSRLFG